MIDPHLRTAAAIAAVAQATAINPPTGDLLSMVLQMAPQLIFGVAVYYMFTKSQDKSAVEIKSLTDKFEGSLDRVTTRFEKQQQCLVDELKSSAQQDRDQHGKLFGDFMAMTREVYLQLNTLQKEFAALKSEQAAMGDRRRSVSPDPGFRRDRPGDGDDPGLPRPAG